MGGVCRGREVADELGVDLLDSGVMEGRGVDDVAAI